MAQGEAILALVKTHEITKNQKYLESAKLLLNLFFVEVKDGGVTLKSSKNEWWYEEYAHEKCQISRVLNGMMIAVLYIYKYFEYTNDADAKLLFDNGIRALVRNLHTYDFRGYSYYDALKRPAGEKYHSVHVRFAKLLYDITNEQVFGKYYDIWRSYKPPKASRISNLAKKVLKL